MLVLTAGAGAAGCGGDATGAGAPAPSSGGHMWAAGERGLMASAFDGVTLVARPPVTGEVLRTLVGVDDQLAWAFGDRGTILGTRDGGSSWTVATIQDAGTLRAASFADAGRGYAVGDAGVVLRTSDAGATWARLAVPPLPAPGALRGVATAPSGGLVLAVGDGGAVLRSADGGDRFERVAVPAGITANLNAVRLAEDELHALAVGDGGVVLSSEDGGITWRAEATAPGDLTAVALRGSGATAVGAGGLVWRRADPSRPFAAVASGTAVDLHGIKFDREAPDFGWVVGAGGVVLYTADGGARFRLLASPMRGDLTTVEDF